MSVERGHGLDRTLLSSLRGDARRLGSSVVVVPGQLTVGTDVSDKAVAVVALRRGAGAGAAVGGRGEKHGAAVGVHVGGCHDGWLPFGIGWLL